MATQASAITFLSTPGQGYLDGMGFVQFYFGLPLAMIVIGAVFIPLYYKWKVYTAYEFIGRRFDGRARLLTAGLFLIQRSLAAGITIYAPSIILSKVLHWPLSWTCVFIGVLVILYTTDRRRARGGRHAQAADGRDLPRHLHRLRADRALPERRRSDFGESLRAGAARWASSTSSTCPGTRRTSTRCGAA